MRATAVLDMRPHTRWAARVDREQGRAHSLQPEGRGFNRLTSRVGFLTGEHGHAIPKEVGINVQVLSSQHQRPNAFRNPGNGEVQSQHLDAP
jgi:hypothetical protein